MQKLSATLTKGGHHRTFR